MNKTLPTLSKAQREAWARILRTRHADGHFNQALASNRTLKALVNKGMLIAEVNSIGWTEYTIHPDYLPTPAPEADASDQDAAPVMEDAPSFERGDIVRTKAIPAGEPLTVASTYTSPFNGKTYVRARVNGEPVSYIETELEPVTSKPGEPEAALDADRTKVLNAMMASYERRIADLEAENERLRVFLSAIKDEAETDLGDWIGVVFDQVFPSKRAMKAIYEGARDALNPPADES